MRKKNKTKTTNNTTNTHKINKQQQSKHEQNQKNPQACSDRYVQIRAERYTPLEITRCSNYFRAESDKISKFVFFKWKQIAF